MKTSILIALTLIAALAIPSWADTLTAMKAAATLTSAKKIHRGAASLSGDC